MNPGRVESFYLFQFYCGFSRDIRKRALISDIHGNLEALQA